MSPPDSGPRLFCALSRNAHAPRTSSLPPEKSLPLHPHLCLDRVCAVTPSRAWSIEREAALERRDEQELRAGDRLSLAGIHLAVGIRRFGQHLGSAQSLRVIEGCHFATWADFSASRVVEYLHGLRADRTDAHGHVKRGISAQTFNFYVQAVKQFCRWMVKDRRAIESPVAHLNGLNAKTDRRHDRRALTVEQLRRLLDSTRQGPELKGMTGQDRAMLYRLAVETGLRAGELRSLTCSSFDLDGHPPTVTVAAAYSKRRREDTLPLRTELANNLRNFLAHMSPAAPVFKMPEPRCLNADRQG